MKEVVQMKNMKGVKSTRERRSPDRLYVLFDFQSVGYWIFLVGYWILNQVYSVYWILHIPFKIP